MAPVRSVPLNCPWNVSQRVSVVEVGYPGSRRKNSAGFTISIPNGFSRASRS